MELRGQRLSSGATQQPVSLEFESGGRVSGSTGCNRLTGSYTQNGSQLHFSPLATTRMMCAQGADIEAAYVKALGEVQTYNFDTRHAQPLRRRLAAAALQGGAKRAGRV